MTALYHAHKIILPLPAFQVLFAAVMLRTLRTAAVIWATDRGTVADMEPVAGMETKRPTGNKTVGWRLLHQSPVFLYLRAPVQFYVCNCPKASN